MRKIGSLPACHSIPRARRPAQPGDKSEPRCTKQNCDDLVHTPLPLSVLDNQADPGLHLVRFRHLDVFNWPSLLTLLYTGPQKKQALASPQAS